MANANAYILGINAYDHDVSACLLRNGEIAFAISKERITRQKHASGFFKEVVDYCLDAEGITLDDVNLVVRNCYVMPVDEMEKRLMHQDTDHFLDYEERYEVQRHPLFLSKSPKLVTVSHHLAHAYSAFAACPFDQGVVMIVDGVGSYQSDALDKTPLSNTVSPLARESESYYKFEGSKLEVLHKVWMGPTRGFLSDEFYNMPGLGALYSRASAYIFADWNKCGEVMGLAPYGRPDRMKPLLTMKDGELEVPDWFEDFDRPWLPDRGQDWETNRSLQHWEDLAWRTQDDTERVLLERATWLRKTTGATNLCMAGGVALNCVANGRLAREAGFDNVWVQPAAGDDGIAIGCAYYGHLAVRNEPRAFVMNHAYLGVKYRDDDVHDTYSKGIAKVGTVRKASANICADAARILAEGKVVGWFQDGSEFGPRALGNRSILADPRTAEMKDILNKRVKHRQAFRPFAPIVLEERANEIFEGEGDSPFMLMAKSVNPEWRKKIPAIVHVDGTARLQTVREDTNPTLYRLLKEFEALTGVPVLVNTSFNVKGEPIVETPQDAMDCFLATGIDVLVLHDMVIEKNLWHRVLTPVYNLYSDIKGIVQAEMKA